MKDLYETFIKMYEQKNFLSFYYNEINKRGYTLQESQYIKGKIEIFEVFINDLSYRVLFNLLKEKTYKRLNTIISGQEYLAHILSCPDDYKLIVDLDTLEDNDVSNALIFTEVKGRYCYFKHRDECEIGFNYSNEDWKSM